MSCGSLDSPKTFCLTSVSFTPWRPRGIFATGSSGSKNRVVKGLSWSCKDNPMLSSQSHQVELPTAVYSHIHYNLSGYSIKLIDAHIGLIWQRDDWSRKFLRVIFDLCNSLHPLFSWCVIHEAPVSLLQLMVGHHCINGRALDR